MKTIDELRAVAQSEYDMRMATLARIEKYYPLLADGLGELDPHAYADPFDLNISFTGDKRALERAFGILRRNGFVPEERPKANQPSFHTRFRQIDGASVWLSFSSRVCKRVQVGTRTVEEPVYEIQCDDAPAKQSEPESDEEMVF